MANKSKVSDTGQELFTVRSSLVRHLNKQVSGADGSTVFGEAIANPAYREAASDEYLGILLVGMTVDRKYTDPFLMHAGAAHIITSQIQYGDQTAAPALMDRDNQFLHAHGDWELGFATSASFVPLDCFPLSLHKMHPDDVIVTPSFTIVHDFFVNTGSYQTADIQTELLYHIVTVPDKVFTRMLMDQTRTS